MKPHELLSLPSLQRSPGALCTGTLAAALLALLAAEVPAQAPSIDWTILKPSNTGIPGDYCYEAFVDASGRPWISGFHPFFGEGGAGQWDEATNTWFTLSNVDYPILPSERWYDVEGDANGVMWIGTDAGLVRYDPAVGPSSLQAWTASNSPMPGDFVRSVSVAPDGTIWLGIDNNTAPPGGLVRFDPVLNEWSVWTTANGLPWGEAWPGWDWIDYVAAAPDDDGGYTVYFGSLEMGAGSYKNGEWVTYNLAPPPGPVVWSTAGKDPVDDLGNTWLKTDQGVMLRKPDGTLTPVDLPPGGSGTIAAFSGGRAAMGSFGGQVWSYDGSTWEDLGFWGGGTIYGIAEEPSGAIWVSGTTGAARYANGAWQRYRVTNTGMVGRFLETIDFDSAGNVYMNGNAGPGVGGFSIYDGQRWTCVNDYNYGLGPAWGQLSDDVDVLCVRADGRMPLDVGVGGLQQWDGEGYSPLNTTWNTFGLDEDGLGRVWSGNFGKLFLYDEQGGYTEFNTANSPMLDLPVRTIEADDQQPGWIWAATPLGVVHTNGVDWETWPSSLLGFTIQESVGDLSVAPDGTFWMATSEGVIHFDPATQDYEQYLPGAWDLPTKEFRFVEVAPDGSVWASSFDFLTFPYPGGLSHFDGTTWTTYTTANSPLPHNQHAVLTSRAIPGGYEVWVGTSSEGIAVVTVQSEVLCQTNLGFGGPGTATLDVCGQALTPGNTASIDLAGAPPAAPAWLVWGFGQGALPLAGGTLVPSPPFLAGPLGTDAGGALKLPITNTFGALDLYAQYAIVDLAQPQLIALSNAVKIEFLP